MPVRAMIHIEWPVTAIIICQFACTYVFSISLPGSFYMVVAHDQLLIAKGKTFSPERQSVHTLI